MFQTNNNNKPKLQLKPNLGENHSLLCTSAEIFVFNLTTFFFRA